MKKLCFVLALCAAMANTAHAATKLTYVDLVRRLMDLEALAVLPVEGEQCMQWSSYDRASRYDAETGKYVAWEANNDGYDIIRAEGDFQVLAEIEGPGCIRRIWSAMAEAGHVRIYLDGAAGLRCGLRAGEDADRSLRPTPRSTGYTLGILGLSRRGGNRLDDSRSFGFAHVLSPTSAGSIARSLVISSLMTHTGGYCCKYTHPRLHEHNLRFILSAKHQFDIDIQVDMSRSSLSKLV